jgi:hypothetical protein
MPTTYKSGKKRTTTKRKPTKKPAKKGGKGGGSGGDSGSGSEGGEAFGPQDPIVISGGGSVNLKMNGRFKDHGPGSWKNDDANLVSLSIDGRPPIPLAPTSKITIRLS